MFVCTDPSIHETYSPVLPLGQLQVALREYLGRYSVVHGVTEDAPGSQLAYVEHLYPRHSPEYRCRL